MKTLQQIRMVNLASLARLFLVVSVALIAVLSLPGCGQNQSSNPSSNNPPPPTYYSLSTSVSPPGGGSVSPSNGTYLSGTSVTLTATPTLNYQFVSWSGDASGTNLTTTITMNSNKNVIATFEQVLATAATQTLNGAGYIALPYGGVYLQAGQTLTLSWSADGSLEGYIFTQNQFNNFKAGAFQLSYEAYSQGASGTISWQVQNGDIYYGVVANRLITAPSVKLYQAKLTLR